MRKSEVRNPKTGKTPNSEIPVSLPGRVLGAGLAATFVLTVGLFAGEPPKARPEHWAQPVLNTTIGNLFKVSEELYRSEQVDAKDLPDLKALGIRTIYNLRHYHNDSEKLAQSGIKLMSYELKAGSVTVQDLRAILEDIRKAPKPVLVHCWHGSDRTGFVVAGYRVVFQKWSKEAAAEELRLGGYGYHARTYPNVIETLLTAELD